jgi:hypothetical protein
MRTQKVLCEERDFSEGSPCEEPTPPKTRHSIPPFGGQWALPGSVWAPLRSLYGGEMTSDDLTRQLRDAWPDVPDGMKPVLERLWTEVAARLDTEGDPCLNDFTIPLAGLAHDAGFQHDAQGKEFIRSAISAAKVPPEWQNTVAVTFAVQLHFRNDS